MSNRTVIVFAYGKRFHMPYLEQMPGCQIPMASRMTVCQSKIGLAVTESWARRQGRTPCRNCYEKARTVRVGERDR